jgi:hypothetical protein
LVVADAYNKGLFGKRSASGRTRLLALDKSRTLQDASKAIHGLDRWVGSLSFSVVFEWVIRIGAHQPHSVSQQIIGTTGV